MTSKPEEKIVLTFKPPPDVQAANDARLPRSVQWLALGIGGFIVLCIIIANNPKQDVTTTIEQECTRSYGSYGTERVQQCRLEMMGRILREADERLREDTYRRIR